MAYKNNKALTFLVGGLIILFMNSCTKQNAEELIKEAECTLPDGPLTGWNYVITPYFYDRQDVNPNNSNEIVFVSQEGGPQVIKYDLTTQTKTTIYSGIIYFRPDWGINGWILLNIAGNIYKIKDNGDSLTAIISDGSSFGPAWNYDCTAITYHTINSAIICDVNGTMIDTFGLHVPSITPNSWYNSIVFGGGNNQIGFYDFSTDISNYVYTPADGYAFTGGVWISPSEVVWSNKSGIFKTTYPSGATVLIKSSCDTKYFIYPTFLQSQNKMLFTKRTFKAISSSDLEETSELITMDIDGSNETQIIIE